MDRYPTDGHHRRDACPAETTIPFHLRMDAILKRIPLVALLIFGACCSTSIADDFLLRLDAIGYVDKPISEKAIKETTLRSMEVVARPDSAFRGRVDTGSQTFTMSGNLRRSDTDGFHVEIRYTHSIDTGITVAIRDGNCKPLPKKVKMQTTVKIVLDESIVLGVDESTTSEPAQPELHSKTRYVIRLTKFTPTDD